jgi:penicillin-binding protein 2
MTVAVFVAISVIVFRLAYIQIVHGADYRRDADNNRLREVVQEAPRGKIVDAHGVILAANQPGYFVSMHHTRSPELDDILARLVAILDPLGEQPEQVSVAEFRRRLHAARFRRWRPVRLLDTPLAFGDVRLIQIEERRMELPGVIVEVQPVRSYPLGQSAAHVLGGMGRNLLDAEQTRAKNELLGFGRYRVDSVVGRFGLEQSHEFVPRHLSLRGVDGFQRVEVDHLSRPVREVGVQEPIPGNNLHLTLDAALQQQIEAWLPGHLERMRAAAYAAGVRGAELELVAREAAVVAIDPKTGAVLALVSHPAFSPAELVENFGVLSADPGRPLENKAITAFVPGSIFKPVTEIAGLVHGAQAAMPRIVCTGRLMDDWLGARGKPCWIEHYRTGHGRVDDVAAMRVSCNIYFYQIGMQLIRQLGNATVLDAFAEVAAVLGLGAHSPLQAELFGFGGQAGVLPTSERFREGIRRTGERRPLNPYPGEVADITIGQGIQTYTPLQMANMMAMLATGHRYENFIVDRVVSPFGEVVSRTQPRRLASLVRTPKNPDGLVSADQLARIQEGLRQVTQVGGLGLNSGTAAGAFRGATYFSAGKTGTAEVFRGRVPLPSHAWFTGWGADPITREPEIVVSVLVRHGRGGSLAAAPVARQVMDTYFNLKAQRANQ